MKFNNENYDAAIKYLKDNRVDICKRYYSGEENKCFGDCDCCSFYCNFVNNTDKNILIKNIKETVRYNRKMESQCGQCLINPCHDGYCADKFCKMFNLKIHEV